MCVLTPHGSGEVSTQHLLSVRPIEVVDECTCVADIHDMIQEVDHNASLIVAINKVNMGKKKN